MANKSAIFPFLGGTSRTSDVTSRISCACLGPTFFLGCFCENPVNSFETHEIVPDRSTVVGLLVMADPLSSRQVTVLQRVAVCSSCSTLQCQVLALCYSVLHVLQYVDVLQLTAGASG